MITLKNIRTLSGPLAEHTFPGEGTQIIDGENRLLMLPAWIDSDISLGKLNGKSEMEWKQVAHELFQTGATTVIDNSGLLPNAVKHFTDHISALFRGANIPLRLHHVFDGSDPSVFNDIGKNKSLAAAIKAPVELLREEQSADRLFQMTAQEDMVIILPLLGYATPEAALNAVTKALALAEKYCTQVSFQHIRTAKELALIAQAKAHEMLVFAEVAYPHLFFTDEELKKKQLVLPGTFLPTQDDQEALWKGIKDGTVDTLGSGNHLLPAGNFLPAGKLMLPFMLDACRHEKLSYEKLVELIRINVERIYRLSPTKDVVLVDMEAARPLPGGEGQSILSLWSGRPLAGWPAYVIAQGNVYSFAGQ